MSAVPLAAVVVGGTSALPSSVAFIFSAKAGPAKAIAAPSAIVASMVLFDMVFSLLTSNDGVSFKTTPFRIYSRNGAERAKFPASLWRKVRPYYPLDLRARFLF